MGQIALRLVSLDLLLRSTVGSYVDSQGAMFLLLLNFHFQSLNPSLDFELALGAPVLLHVSESSGYSG